MTYRHKRTRCFRSTSEILAENCLTIREALYDLQKVESSIVRVVSAVASVSFSNVLEVDASPEQSDTSVGDNVPRDHRLEDYAISEKIDFRAVDTKEHIEKKERRRNYIEFRSDY